MKKLLHPQDGTSKGAALIIVLAFVVLATVFGLAYFSRTTTDWQLAQSSSNDISADFLARSALDIVVNDFKQEVSSNGILLAAGTPTPTPPPTPTPCKSIVSAQIVNSGSYYIVGDTLDPVSGTLCALADNYGFRLQVASVNGSGGVTAVTIIPGIGYYVLPSNPPGLVALIGFGGSATGTGFTANCTFQSNP